MLTTKKVKFYSISFDIFQLNFVRIGRHNRTKLYINADFLPPVTKQRASVFGKSSLTDSRKSTESANHIYR